MYLNMYLTYINVSPYIFRTHTYNSVLNWRYRIHLRQQQTFLSILYNRLSFRSFGNCLQSYDKHPVHRSSILISKRSFVATFIESIKGSDRSSALIETEAETGMGKRKNRDGHRKTEKKLGFFPLLLLTLPYRVWGGSSNNLFKYRKLEISTGSLLSAS